MKFPLRIVADNTSFNFVGKRFAAFAFSIAISILALFLLISEGLTLGIDFTGGIVIEARMSKVVNIASIRDALNEVGYRGAIIQNFGKENDVLIRLQSRPDEDQAKAVENIKQALIATADSDVSFRRIDYVGPKVGDELIKSGIMALVLALVGILIYVAVRFSWEYGVCAIVALLHNAWITVGFFLISRYEFDLSSIAAILTIIGYSINDTVVIFDRVRENLRKYKVKNLADLINSSLNETLSRTIMTVSTTVIVCLSLVVFGGEVIRGFSMAMLFGIAFGTYCSNLIAAPLLIYTGLKQETIA